MGALSSIMAGEGAALSRLTSEQEDAYAYWSQPPYWNFLTGTWPLKGTKTRPAVPIWWTFDPDLKMERPMPSKGYEYARDAILEPLFCWKPASPADKLRAFLNKSRKVLGTLWVVSAAGAETIFRDSVSWKLAKGKREEAQDLIVERLRWALDHPNYPAWLRRYRPVRPKPLGRFARFSPGSAPGIYKSMISAVGQNFATKEGKGGTNDFIIDEAVELEGLRVAVEAVDPGARRIVMIATPPEPGAKGKRIDPDSIAFCREFIAGKTIDQRTRIRSADVDMTGVGETADDDADVELIGAR